jgi:hypothetical protein
MPRLSRISRPWFWSITVAVLYVVVHIIEDELGKWHVSTWLVAGGLMAWSVWVGFRYHTILTTLIGLTAGLLAWHYEAAMHLQTPLSRESWTVHLIAFVVLLMFSLPSGLLQRKRTHTWRRWMFARAEEIIRGEDAAAGRNGYLPQDELRRFGAFLDQRRIATPLWENESLMLLLPCERSLLQSDARTDKSCTKVIFQPDGQILAHVSREDFQEFEGRHSYTLLCRGLGDVLFDFLQRHRLGENDLILREVYDDTREAEAILVILGGLVFLLASLLYLQII